MQYQVPQFIETESKIIGPLTIKQFVYLGVAGLLSFFLFFILQFVFWVLITVILGASAAALAFIKINGQPLPVILKSGFLYLWKPKLYLWKRKEAQAKIPAIEIPKTSRSVGGGPVSKLKSLWLNLNTKKPSGPPSRKPTREAKPLTKQGLASNMEPGEAGLRLPNIKK